VIVAAIVFALCATSASAGAPAPKGKDTAHAAYRKAHHARKHRKRKRHKRAKRVKSRLSITTTSPGSGSSVSGGITWKVTVSGGTPTRVDFAVDGAVRWSQSASPFLYRGVSGGLDSTQLGNGLHTLTATAYAAKGRKASSQVTVSVANSVAAPSSSSTTPPPSPATPNSVYWGASIGPQLTGMQAPWDMNAVSQFEDMAGRQLSLVHFFAPFANCSSAPCSFYNFPTTPMENVRQHGAIPFFSWSSQSIPSSKNEPDFQLADVINGTYDSYITSFATAAKNWGHPFFLRFNWEMNGAWFPWSEHTNGNSAGQYVAAWRHVHDIFTTAGATNATWTWCPNVDFDNSLQSMASLYPGDAYVDWTCLDGYNWGTNPVKPQGWKSFDQLYSSSYHQITDTIAPSKPMVIGETSSTEYGGSKGSWIQDTLSKIPSSYPKIRGLVWFERHDDSMDWPIETSSSATSGFANGIQHAAYTGNSYANLPPGPIQPPS
jgi:hypothetical protein